MCGIIGAISNRDVSQLLVAGLKRLEYRGYDSAGIAIIHNENELKRVRVQGKVKALAEAVSKNELSGKIGIAHTRWATHGKPSEINAHPHTSNSHLAIVHNGIIENHGELKSKLINLGYKFQSETDTEVAAHLIHCYYQETGNLLSATQKASQEMQGAFAIGVIHKSHPDEIVAIRKGSPLVLGFGIDENFIASDEISLRSFAQSIIHLEEGDSAVINKDAIQVYDEQFNPVSRKTHTINTLEEAIDKGPFRHYMLKEIYEQKKAIIDTIEGRTASPEVLKSCFGEKMKAVFNQVKNIQIVACGTSYHAGLIAKHWLESMAQIPTQVDIASEYRYRDIIVMPGTLFITISQSGETADTLAALKKAKSLDYLFSLGICNVASSSLARESDSVFLTRAGIEIGVASTKAFTTQLVSLLMLSAALSSDDQAKEVIKEIERLPHCIDSLLSMDKDIEELSNDFVNKSHCLFLGRGIQYPVAMEGALKLKEISYIHAEAYPAGELKHGPLALVDEEMPVIAVAPNDELLIKLKSNLQEVSARGAKLYVFIDDSQDWSRNGAKLIKIPYCGFWVSPIIYTIPLQLLAYHVAVAKGTDVDQPRNLAKSVTVE